ncbi:MAG TPA: transcription elongation factor GreA [Firmicutes bacterium]|nr:transcription elongation factor GreA [Bacillota bacterium]
MKMAKQFILTDDGLKKYEQELEELKTVKRKEVADKIKVALSFGDLSENSEYDEAKNDQAKLEARIVELEAMLQNAKVIDEKDLSTDTVNVGSRVKVLDMEYDEEITYKIVGSAEADPKQGLISDESPLGKQLIGSKIGDTVTIEAPAGEIHFKIVDISL